MLKPYAQLGIQMRAAMVLHYCAQPQYLSDYEIPLLMNAEKGTTIPNSCRHWMTFTVTCIKQQADEAAYVNFDENMHQTKL